MRKIVITLIIFLPAFYLPAFCQTGNTALKDNISKLQAFYSGHMVEKAYLQFNKPCYGAGDTIYFKAYVTIGEQHQLSGESGVLYIDLIDPQNTIEQSIKLHLQQGLAWGDFALPDEIPQGNYAIRAYTRLMANQPGTCFFEQAIPVFSSNNSVANNQTPPKSNKPDLQFFPEGGKLLAGVESRVAFKAIDPDGLGIAVKGTVVDNTGTTAVSIASSRLGMGVFTFTPEEGKTYKAKVTYADGSQDAVDLPPVAADGIVLSIDNSDTSVLTLGIRCNTKFFEANKDKTFGLIMNSGNTASNASIRLSNPLQAVDLKASQFKTGIIQFTLFSPEGVPLSERLVFNRGSQLLKLAVAGDKPGYKAGEKTALTFNIKNNTGVPVQGHFSVAVVDESNVTASENTENSILSWLMLSTDLKGYIEQPSYYFENNMAETRANLDMLILTQGFRRFKWDDLLAGKYPPITFQPEKSLYVRGSVTTVDGKPVTQDKINLICIDGGPILSQETDSLGRFDFPDLSQSKGDHYIIRESSSKAKNQVSYFADKPEPVITTDQPLAEPLQSGTGNIAPPSNTPLTSLKTTPSPAKLTGTNGGEYDSFRSRMGTADQVITFDGAKTSGNLSDHLNGLLSGVTFSSPQPGAAKVPFLTGSVSMGAALNGNPPMQVIVDGVPLGLGSGVDDINLNDVKSVEVYRGSSASILGANGMGGVLCVYTITGAAHTGANEMGKGTLSFTLNGYYQPREFYSPKYEHKTGGAKDLRSAIYWNPEIVPDKDGNVSLNYYNADGTGNYRVVIEGIDESGNLGCLVYRYKVE